MKQNREIWRDIPGYEGYYEASNLGRVRSLDRIVLTKNGREYFYKGRIFEGSDNKGYKRVTLSRDGKQRGFNISQLIAMTFLKHTPNGYSLVVDHINGVRSDNRVENLQIVTHRENNSTCYRANEDSFTSEFIGASYHKSTNKWESQIYFNSKRIYLGYYSTEKDASTTYKKALAELKNGTFKIEDYKVKWTSKYKGISRFRNKWRATPYINGKQVYLGVHTTELEAFQAILEYEAIQPIVNNS